MSGLQSLINFVGDKKLKLQFLAGSITKIKTKRHDTEVTFAAEHDNITADALYRNDLKKVGIVVWIDVEDFEAWRQGNN